MEELSLTTPALLFSAVSLILLAYTNRFLSYAQLVRTLKEQHLQQMIIVLFRSAKIRYFFHTGQRAVTIFYKNLKNTYDQVLTAPSGTCNSYRKALRRLWPCFCRGGSV